LRPRLAGISDAFCSKPATSGFARRMKRPQPNGNAAKATHSRLSTMFGEKRHDAQLLVDFADSSASDRLDAPP